MKALRMHTGRGYIHGTIAGKTALYIPERKLLAVFRQGWSDPIVVLDCTMNTQAWGFATEEVEIDEKMIETLASLGEVQAETKKWEIPLLKSFGVLN